MSLTRMLPGQTVLVRGYLFQQGGVPIPVPQFGRLAGQVVRTGLNDMDVRVPAMTCAGTRTKVRIAWLHQAMANRSRDVEVTVRPAQPCPAPVMVSATPATVARGGTVVLNVTNIGPMDPNLAVERQFGPGQGRSDNLYRGGQPSIEAVGTNQVTVRMNPNGEWGQATLFVITGNGRATTPLTITQ